MAIPIETVKTALGMAKGIISVAAANLGISRQALHKRINNNKTLKEALYQAKETNKDFAEGKLLNAINADNLGAIKYYLSTQAKDRGYQTRDNLHDDIDKYSININYEVVKNEQSKRNDK